MNGRVDSGADMARTAQEARAALERAIERFGGLRKLSAEIDLGERSLQLWLKHGNLNKVQARSALRFSKAVKKPLRDFIVDD